MIKVLRIDTTWEVLTDSAYRLRGSIVYPLFQASGYQLVPAINAPPIASRQEVAPLAIDQSVRYITGCGHGTVDQFQGNFNRSIFPEGIYQPNEVSNKIVHFLSCSTAAQLGPDFLLKGCRAFIGYNAPFVYDPAWASVFFTCDAQIDLALAEGRSVSSAVNLAKSKFEIELGKPANQAIVGELESRRDSLVALGANLDIGIAS